MQIFHAAAAASLLMSGAIFGFFYAWVCSTMWGLDAADPRIAMAAMQAMNASVRNAVFFPAFFLTPVVTGLTAWLAFRHSARRSGRAFGLAALIYGLGGLVLTMAVNVPMNEALAALPVPETKDAAQAIWTAYSGQWQVWNILRTCASGLALACVGLGLRHMPGQRT